jgi:hypothetical protein
MGESILRDRVIPFESGVLCGARLSKGKRVNIPAPGRGYCVVTQTNSETSEVALGRVLFSC